jgi:hypothetical protein
MKVHLSAFPHVRLPCLHACNVHDMSNVREIEVLQTLVPSNISITYLCLAPALCASLVQRFGLRIID